MKKLIYLFVAVAAFGLSSCGASSEVVDKAAKEMCGIMEQYNPADIMGSLDVVSKLGDFAKKDEYQSITQDQMVSALEKQCPEGAKKYKELTSYGK